MEINEEAEDSDEDTFSAAPNEEIDPFRQFVCCGAHRLNNAIQGAIKGMPLFSQANAFCLKFGGPKLCDTRWYGHLRQLELEFQNWIYSPPNVLRIP